MEEVDTKVSLARGGPLDYISMWLATHNIGQHVQTWGGGREGKEGGEGEEGGEGGEGEDKLSCDRNSLKLHVKGVEKQSGNKTRGTTPSARLGKSDIYYKCWFFFP